jgi:Flp pilus assembly protein TadD
MKKETILFVGVALIVGVLVGLLISKGSKSSSSVQSSSPVAPVVNSQQDIQLMKKVVAGDPDNGGAWVQLGHAYYDADQPVKAIEAYNKALAITPNNPDVLTDQGVMFRQLGWFDRAEENFLRASELDPGHHQSLYNLGVVYRYDLKDLNRAREAWTRYLQINPSGPGADNIRRELDALLSSSTLAPPE